jgi:PTS system cellobiose-specific IIC component
VLITRQQNVFAGFFRLLFPLFFRFNKDLSMLWLMTMGRRLNGVYAAFMLVAFMMVYQEMGSLKHRNYQVVGGLTGICAYILAMKGTTVDGVYSVTRNRFGPTGIVVAICIGLYVSIIFHLIAKLNLFKNNNTIPEFVQEWIKNIIPIFLSILLLKIVIIDLDVDLYPIVLKLFAPINAIAQTYPGFILLNLFCCFFYSLGIS